MPQPRKYNSPAERQAAYRKSQQQAIAAHLEQKGLPPLPVVSTIPGRVRWNQAMSAIESQLSRIELEMENYHDARSDRWQESDKGDEFRQKLEGVKMILELVTEWLI